MSGKEKVLVVDDDELIGTMLSRALKHEGYEVSVETIADNVVDEVMSWGPDVVMLDINLPGKTGIEILEELKGKEAEAMVVILTADDTAETAVKAMKLGAVDYLTKPFNIDEVKIVIKNVIEKEKLRQEVNYYRKMFSKFIGKDIIGESGPINELKSKLQKLIQAHVSTILITGESGTGKELVARHIHRLMHGDAEYTPFIRINCAALPESLLESELFGYERGAFTDAKSDKKGLFELADGGSILLDEIGEMKQNLQSKLLRVIEERTVRRIGGKDEIPINAVVIATTNRNLSDAVEKGDFRLDLFYRLNAFALHLPSLSERKEDVPMLATHFLSIFVRKYNKQIIKGFSPEAEKLMVAYRWPGNVRELKNTIERLVVLENTEEILPEHLPKEILNQPVAAVAASRPTGGRFVLPENGISIEDLEKDLIMQALERAKHNKTLAAKLLNTSYDSLRYQIKKLGLED